jgi:hypothetical protein
MEDILDQAEILSREFFPLRRESVFKPQIDDLHLKSSISVKICHLKSSGRKGAGFSWLVLKGPSPEQAPQ